MTMNASEEITVVQSVTTRWSKESRGAPGAVRRNAVPETLTIPIDACVVNNHCLIEHKLEFREWENFDYPKPIVSTCSFEQEEFVKYRGITIQRTVEGLHVGWNYSPEQTGMPIRSTKKTDMFDLRLNQWGQVMYNGRFSEWEGGWWYRKTVLNIGLFSQPIGSIFVETNPDVILNKMAELY